MKNKKMLVIVVVLIISALVVGFIVIKKNNNKIPDGYIAVFHGGVGEQTYETYIYKIDNGKENYGFKYINVTTTKSLVENGKSNYKIIKRGKFDWTEKAFNVARENNAYSYVTVPYSDRMFTIDEFAPMFIMD